MSDPQSPWFGVVLSPEEVRRRSVGGAAQTFVRRIGLRALGFGSTLLLARLLTPADFGLVAMTGAAVGLAGLFADLALSKATLRYKPLTHAQASNVFWLRLALGASMAALVFLIAPLTAAFFDDPRVTAVARVSAFGMMLGSIGGQHSSLLRRAMRFGALTRLEVSCAVTGILVSLAGAAAGLGYWALIAGAQASGVLGTILAWRACDWRPALPARGVDMAPMLALGLRMTSFNALAFVAGNLSNVIIGRSWGPAAAALYNRANGLQNQMLGQFWSPLDMVAVPALVQLSGDRERLCAYYYQLAALCVMACLPVIFVCLALPEELVTVLFGEQWRPAGRLLPLLALGALPTVINHTAAWVNASIGNARLLVWWGFVGWGSMILATLVGSLFGIEGIALAGSLMAALTVVPCLRFSFHDTPLTMRGLATAVMPPLTAAVIAGLASVLVLRELPATAGGVARLASGCMTFGAVYALLLLTVFGQRQRVVDLIAELRRRRAAAAPA